jgi:MoaA/NifB/PqqE/SkfB family radical SAM enzyme
VPLSDLSVRDPAVHDAGSAPLRARLSTTVRLRKETFGAIVYVPHRDHFYALDAEHTAALRGLGSVRMRPVAGRRRRLIVAMAAAGICETEPATPERAFYGRSQFGAFPAGLPSSRSPLVVNCFTTAHCPLRCAYCHADDLMAGYRDADTGEWLDEVIRVAKATPAMVGVVTGGEPLSRPERAERLLATLAHDKAVVLDTSGVGDLRRLVPHLRQYGAHVRVSLDSADPAVNDRLRPINRRYLPFGDSSFRHAWDAVELAVGEGLACSVQTVVTARNADLGGLLELRDRLVATGVRTWTLHVVVAAGKAADRSRGLLTEEGTEQALVKVVDDTAGDRLPIDIRITSTHRVPNSTLMISAMGELAVQRPDGTGKDIVPLGRYFARRRMRRQFLRRVDLAGHASRYLNGALDLYPAAADAVTPELPAVASAI